MARTDFPFPNFPNLDVTKLMAEFKLPGLDMDALLKAQQKNIEALTEANRKAAEGFQAVAKRQTEILTEAMEEFSDTVRDMMAGGSPEANAAKQAEVAKLAFEKALANMRELAEMSAKANSAAFEAINRRVMESLEEIKAALASLKK